MPIRPEDRDRYPPEWPEISERIRVGRAGNRCECTGECGADHGGDTDCRCTAMHGKPHPVTTSLVVLTVGHVDQTPEHCEDENLRAWCQDCHLAFDQEHHVAQAMWTRSLNRLADRAHPELFPLPLGPAGPRHTPEPTMTHFWRIRTTLADRHGQHCRIVARGKLNSVLVEFADGARHVVSRWAVRRRPISAPPAPAQLEVRL